MSEDSNEKSTKKTQETGSTTSKSSTTKTSGAKGSSTGETSSSKGSTTQASSTGGSGSASTSTSAGSGAGRSSSTAQTAEKASTASTEGASTESASSSAGSSSAGTTGSGSGEPFMGNSGLPRHVAAGLSYVLGPITAVIFLVLDRADPLVRYHASQSLALSAVIIVAWIAVAVLAMGFAGMPVIFWLGFIFLLYMAVMSFQSKDWEIPFIGDYSQKLADKVDPGE